MGRPGCWSDDGRCGNFWTLVSHSQRFCSFSCFFCARSVAHLGIEFRSLWRAAFGMLRCFDLPSRNLLILVQGVYAHETVHEPNRPAGLAPSAFRGSAFPRAHSGVDSAPLGVAYITSAPPDPSADNVGFWGRLWRRGAVPGQKLACQKGERRGRWGRTARSGWEAGSLYLTHQPLHREYARYI